MGVCFLVATPLPFGHLPLCPLDQGERNLKEIIRLLPFGHLPLSSFHSAGGEERNFNFRHCILVPSVPRNTTSIYSPQVLSWKHQSCFEKRAYLLAPLNKVEYETPKLSMLIYGVYGQQPMVTLSKNFS